MLNMAMATANAIPAEMQKILRFTAASLTFRKPVVVVRGPSLANPGDTDLTDPPRAVLDDGTGLAHVGEGLFLACGGCLLYTS